MLINVQSIIIDRLQGSFNHSTVQYILLLHPHHPHPRDQQERQLLERCTSQRFHPFFFFSELAANLKRRDLALCLPAMETTIQYPSYVNAGTASFSIT